jgi:multiple sugar transport system substrate-binding protein
MKNRPTRLTFQTRLQHFVDTIKRERLSGNLQPGDLLPSELTLGKQFKLSKMSVRKGLDQLVREGVIEKIPRVGNRILPLDSDEKYVVRFACHSSLFEETNLEQLIREFEAQNPRISIRIIPFSFDEYVNSIDRYVVENWIDVLTVNLDQYHEFIRHDRLQLFEPQRCDPGTYEVVRRSFEYEGHLYAKPFVFSPVILCYNKAHFTAKGLPEPDPAWSWDQLLRVSRQLSDRKEHYGFYFHMLSQNRWPVFLLQSGYRYGASARPENNRLFLDSMRLCKELIFSQGMPTVLIADQELQAEYMFRMGKASIIMTTYFNLNYLAGSGVPFEISPLPKHNESRSLLLAVGLGVLRNAVHKEAAQLFVDYLTGYESQLSVRKHCFSIPCLAQAAEWEGPVREDMPARYACYREMLPNLRDFRELGLTSAHLTQLRKDLALYWSGLYDETQLLEKMESVIGNQQAFR